MFIPIIENPRYYYISTPTETTLGLIQLGDPVDVTGAKTLQLVVRTKLFTSPGPTIAIHAYRVWRRNCPFRCLTAHFWRSLPWQ